jgi:hypothetical protein
MGCGCNKNRRVTRPAVVPSPVRNTNANANVKAKEAVINQMQTNAAGMTKEQRDIERKRRIQALAKKFN